MSAPAESFALRAGRTCAALALAAIAFAVPPPIAPLDDFPVLSGVLAVFAVLALVEFVGRKLSAR